MVVDVIIIVLFANVSTDSSKVQNYNSGRTTWQQAALTVALKYGLKRKL